MTDPTLEDGGVSLRPLVEDDVPLLARWFFDPDVLQWHQISEDPPHLRTMEAIRERFEIMRDDPFTEVWRIDADVRSARSSWWVSTSSSAGRRCT